MADTKSNFFDVLKHLGIALAAISTWALWHMQNDFAPDDVFFPPSTVDHNVEDYFSETYYQARALFRKQARAAGAELHALPLQELAHLDLTVDVAVLKGASDKVIVHLSGTHGVEGFAGSAIQSGILQNWTTVAENGNGPTVVFVHAVNPYGFSLLRRFNEHNVDLNRNWLTPEQFKTFKAADPNKFGYMDVNTLFNPTPDASNWENWYWPRAAVALVTKGFGSIKQAVVSGNYHMPTSIFYGGAEIQPSLLAVRDFLTSHIDFAAVTKLAVVDVHTGLGRSGEDTLMLMTATTPTTAERVFRAEFNYGNIAFMDDPTNPVVNGYSEVAGYVSQGVAELLPSPATTDVVAVVQEFGTVPGAFVLKATAQENAFFHHAPTRRLPYAERLRDVFYTHGSASWKQTVLWRGVRVFHKLHQDFSAWSA